MLRYIYKIKERSVFMENLVYLVPITIQKRMALLMKGEEIIFKPKNQPNQTFLARLFFETEDEPFVQLTNYETREVTHVRPSIMFSYKHNTFADMKLVDSLNETPFYNDLSVVYQDDIDDTQEIKTRKKPYNTVKSSSTLNEIKGQLSKFIRYVTQEANWKDRGEVAYINGIPVLDVSGDYVCIAVKQFNQYFGYVRTGWIKEWYQVVAKSSTNQYGKRYPYTTRNLPNGDTVTMLYIKNEIIEEIGLEALLNK